jgi:hypothetical protein
LRRLRLFGFGHHHRTAGQHPCEIGQRILRRRDLHALALRDRAAGRNRHLQSFDLSLKAFSRSNSMIRTSPLILATLMGASFTMAMPAAAQDAELGAENYRQADANGDGVLVYAEFANFIDLNAADGLGNAATVSSRGMHARAFSRVDANGDGIVSPQELQAIQ